MITIGSRSRRGGAWPQSRRDAQRLRILSRKPWLRSTGPRTSLGKSRTRLNATQSGAYDAEMQAIRRYLRWQRRTIKIYALNARALVGSAIGGLISPGFSAGGTDGGGVVGVSGCDMTSSLVGGVRQSPAFTGLNRSEVKQKIKPLISWTATRCRFRNLAPNLCPLALDRIGCDRLGSLLGPMVGPDSFFSLPDDYRRFAFGYSGFGCSDFDYSWGNSFLFTNEGVHPPSSTRPKHGNSKADWKTQPHLISRGLIVKHVQNTVVTAVDQKHVVIDTHETRAFGCWRNRISQLMPDRSRTFDQNIADDKTFGVSGRQATIVFFGEPGGTRPFTHEVANNVAVAVNDHDVTVVAHEHDVVAFKTAFVMSAAVTVFGESRAADQHRAEQQDAQKITFHDRNSFVDSYKNGAAGCPVPKVDLYLSISILTPMQFSYLWLLGLEGCPLPIHHDMVSAGVSAALRDPNRATHPELKRAAAMFSDPVAQYAYVLAVAQYRARIIWEELKAKDLLRVVPGTERVREAADADDARVKEVIAHVDRMPINHKSPKFHEFFDQLERELNETWADAECFSGNVRYAFAPVSARSVLDNFDGYAFKRYLRNMHSQRAEIPYLYPIALVAAVLGFVEAYLTMPPDMPQRIVSAGIVGSTGAAAIVVSRHFCAVGVAAGAWAANSLSRIAYGSFRAISKHAPQNLSDKRFVAGATHYGAVIGIYLTAIFAFHEGKNIMQDVLEQEIEGYAVRPQSLTYRAVVNPAKAGVQWVVRNRP